MKSLHPLCFGSDGLNIQVVVALDITYKLLPSTKTTILDTFAAGFSFVMSDCLIPLIVSAQGSELQTKLSSSP